MFTTPRKVKQESRLRRSLSLTNTSRLHNGNGSSGGGGNAPANSYTSSSSSTAINGEDYSSGEYHRHLHNIEESRDTNTYFQFNGDLNLQRSRYSYTPGETLEPIPDLVDISTGDNSIVIHSTEQYLHRNSGHKPPPYRIPPTREGQLDHQSEDSLIVVTSSDPYHQGVPDSPGLDLLQIHSSKFPIVKEVVISQQDSSGGGGAGGVIYEPNHHQEQQHQRQDTSRIPVPVLSPEYIKKFQNKKITKKHIEWTDERKACFNEENSYLMSSMQQQQQHHQQGGRHFDGIDNPALDLGHSGSNGHIHNSNSVGSSSYSSGGNKMSSGYNYSDSSASQSLSLSSSNTDSLDTVIYKGPSQSTTSIRDWQRSVESNPEFSHRNDTNSYRDSSVLFDGRASYQMQQAPSYQPVQFNGPVPNTTNTFAMEYRHSQQQNQVQQNLSVHSIPSSSTGNSNANNGAVGGNINTSGGGGFSNNMRSGNGTAYGSNPQLPTKSPMLNHKQFSTANGQQQTSLHSTADPVLVDKTKDSTKLFHTKTYNHIKDMISSRFGSGVSSNSKGLNNSVPVNGVNGIVPSSNNVSNNGPSNNNNSNNQLAPTGSINGQSVGSNIANSYIDLTMGVPSYGHAHNSHHHGNGNVPVNGHGQNLPHSYSSSPNANLTNRVQHHVPSGPSYYPPQQNPPSNIINTSASTSMGNGNPANSYKSPNMNDRKNVNTSFRKAIQQSTLKSNLTEDSLQLRPIMENSSQQNYNNRGPQYSANSNSNPTLMHDHQQKYGVETVVQVERAQRALDKLMEAGVSLQRTGSGPMVQSQTNPTVQNRIQQFSPSAGGYGDESQFVSSRPSHQTISQNQQFNQGGSVYPGAHDKIRYQHASEFNNTGIPSYNVKPGPASSNSNSSSGMAMVESSLSSPGSYSASRMPGNNNDELNNHQQPTNNQWAHLHHSNPNELQPPPPLPKSQKPDSAQGSLNTIGLPLPSVVPGETRENGDGSSATMESTSGNMLIESPTALCSKSKSDQLKQITTDLQNIALSVAAEQNLHNNNHSSSSDCEKGSQRVGSGQSHTTTDSGLGTVMLTKSPLNSDPSEHCKPMAGGRPNADSVSSGNDSEWVDLVEPEIQQILEIERSSKSGKLNPHASSGLNPVVNIMTSNPSSAGATTSTPAATSKASLQQKGGSNNNHNGGNNSTNLQSSNGKSQGGNSGRLGDITVSPILHPRQTKSPNQSPKLPKKFDLNAYNKKASRSQSQELLAGPSTSQAAAAALAASSKVKSPRMPSKVVRSNSGSGQRWSNRQQRLVDKNPKTGGQRSKEFTQTLKGAKLTRNAMSKLGQILYSLQDENGDMTSTTGLDFESVLDGNTEFTTDDDDLSTTIDTTDAHAIRRQLESLESMYTEVLKVLGEKKFSRNPRYPPNTAELRAAKRRPYGSMSSLPSSVSSRPFRERSRKIDEKKKVKDLKSINRRFQRLESHVVTLARSVAHISSEIRTQHLMVQEMESIRNELSTLRNQVVKNSMQSQSAQAAAVAAQNFNRNASGRHGGAPCANQTDWTSFRNALPSLTNPCRVRKLTKFFGDEPPLIRIFLKKLGYEKYAVAFEQERIGIMELPYLTEERLNKMGIPMGPRLRILQEAQMCLKPGYHGQNDGHHSHHPNNHNTGNLSVYVV